jgi:hypothetical protein
MKGVFEEVSLGTDENMGKEAAKVLSELNYIENLHLECNIADFRGYFQHGVGSSFATKPNGQKVSLLQDTIRPERTNQIVDAGVSPLHQSIAPFLSGLRVSIFFFSYVVLLA